MSEAELREVCKKQHQQSAINNRRNQITGSASNALKKAQDMLSRAPQIQQFVVGGAAGLLVVYFYLKCIYLILIPFNMKKEPLDL